MSSKSEVPAFHLVIRYSDALGRGVDTIKEHEEVIRAKGAVWMGKLGRPVSESRIRHLNAQVERGITTYVYWVQKRHGTYSWTRGMLAGVMRSLPLSERSCVPKYYKRRYRAASMPTWLKGDSRKAPPPLESLVGTWFKMLELKKPRKTEINKLRVRSSRKPILETLNGSMAGMFAVEIALLTRKKPLREVW